MCRPEDHGIYLNGFVHPDGSYRLGRTLMGSMGALEADAAWQAFSRSLAWRGMKGMRLMTRVRFGICLILGRYPAS